MPTESQESVSSVFYLANSLPGLSPEEYAADFKRGFSQPTAPSSACELAKRLYANVNGEPVVPPNEDALALPSSYGVAGAGLMGVTIAAAFLRVGLSIVAYDPFENARATAKARVRSELLEHYDWNEEARASGESKETLVEKAIERFTTVADLEELAKQTTIVETIPEKINLKKKFYKTLNAAAQAPTTLLTNTSSLQIDDLAQGMSDALDSPICRQRFCAFHFFHPVAVRGLVEIAPNASTERATIRYASQLAQKIVKEPIVVADGPGLLVNRLLQGYLNEALKLLDEGVDPKRLEDICLRLGFEGAPLRVIDEIGVDVSMHAGYSFLKAFPERTHNSPTLAGLVREGRLGRKTARGFYRYKSAVSWTNDAELDCDRADLERLRGEAFNAAEDQYAADRELSDEEIGTRILERILDEAKRIADARIVQTYREIDAGLVLALGFPKDKGGICYWGLATGRL